MTAQVTERKPEKLRSAGKKICLALHHRAAPIDGSLLHRSIRETCDGPRESRSGVIKLIWVCGLAPPAICREARVEDCHG
jgi:hypothetical protein